MITKSVTFTLAHLSVSSIAGCCIAPVIGVSPEVGMGLGALYSLGSTLQRTLLHLTPVGEGNDTLKSIVRNVMSSSTGAFSVARFADLACSPLTEKGHELLAGVYAIDIIATTALDVYTSN